VCLFVLSLVSLTAFAGTGTLYNNQFRLTQEDLAAKVAKKTDGGAGLTALSLASADFNGDRIPDVVAGYSNGAGGVLKIYRGSKQSPFLTEWKTVRVPHIPGLMATGDFDGDGHEDILIAASGSSKIYLMSGDGKGGFAEPRLTSLSGKVTAMISGRFENSTYPDLAIATAGKKSAALLLYSGFDGALKSKPESIALSGAARALAMGILDDSGEYTLAAAAGSDVTMIHPRTLDGARSIEHVGLPFATNTLVAGRFS